MNRLISIHPDPIFAFRKVCDEMNGELSESEPNGIGDEQHSTGVNQAMGGHAPIPGAPCKIGALVPILTFAQKLTLKWIIAKSVSCEQEQYEF